MIRLCGGLFLLLVTALIGSALDKEPIHVHLEPSSSITVFEGASVEINCTWTSSDFTKVSWHFNNHTDNNTCPLSSSRISEEPTKGHIKKTNNTWSTLTILSISASESGWYFCQVTKDIPVLTYNCSNGLCVLVEKNITSTEGPNQTTNPKQTTNALTMCSYSVETPTAPSLVPGEWWWIWVTVAIGVVVLIVLIVGICMLSCKTKETVYENTVQQKSCCWRRDRNRMDSCNLPPSKKVETIKPLRKYDTVPQNRNHRP